MHRAGALGPESADQGGGAKGEPAPGPAPQARALGPARGQTAAGPGGVIETVVSPFHCLYQDALYFHTESHLRLPRGEPEASRLARAALVLYLASAEALVHQAALELGRADLAALVADPSRPLPLGEVWRLLPALIAEGPGPGAFDPTTPPWPQFAELLALRASWAYPGPVPKRRAFYHSTRAGAAFEPLEPHQAPAGLALGPDQLQFPRTGLPRDPYALRPHHLDTARGVLDAAITALDQRLGGALCRDQRHRREPVRVVWPGPGASPEGSLGGAFPPER